MEREPTAELIRTQLRRLRLAAGMTQDDFGKQVHFSDSQISAIETGQRPVDRLFLKRADEVLESDGLLSGLLRIAEFYGQPSFLRPWLEAERVAQQLRCYHPTLIPGLLQTEHYARAVIRADDMLADDEVERRVAARMDRQAILTRPDPPILIAVIEEATLRRADESFRGIMMQQIAHLLDCVQRGGVLILVIPAEVSVHVGHAGPFTLARGTDGDWVGHLENHVGGATIDNDEEIATLLARWESIRSVALPKGQSELVMKEVMESWSTI